jgi:hypothetical protein
MLDARSWRLDTDPLIEGCNRGLRRSAFAEATGATGGADILDRRKRSFRLVEPTAQRGNEGGRFTRNRVSSVIFVFVPSLLVCRGSARNRVELERYNCRLRWRGQSSTEANEENEDCSGYSQHRSFVSFAIFCLKSNPASHERNQVRIHRANVVEGR